MKWITNLYDPRKADAKFRVMTRSDETPNQAWDRQQGWLKDKIIGDPKETKTYSVQALMENDMVGIYLP